MKVIHSFIAWIDEPTNKQLPPGTRAARTDIGIAHRLRVSDALRVSSALALVLADLIVLHMYGHNPFALSQDMQRARRCRAHGDRE